jgi:hypothetical protein
VRPSLATAQCLDGVVRYTGLTRDFGDVRRLKSVADFFYGKQWFSPFYGGSAARFFKPFSKICKIVIADF